MSYLYWLQHVLKPSLERIPWVGVGHVLGGPLVQAPNAKWCLSLGAPVERPPNIHPLFVAKLCSNRKLLSNNFQEETYFYFAFG